MDATRRIDTLIFDWDGTLVDSAGRGFEAFRTSLGEMGVAFSQGSYELHYSPNWYSMYEALGLARERWQEADDLWLRHYGEGCSALLEGACETVRRLKAKGYGLGIVSSGSDCRVRRELEAAGLAQDFEVVVCNEHVVHKKPHPEGLEAAMAVLGRGRESCAYVGDAPEDILMGKSARVMTVGVRSAYPTSRNLTAFNPDVHLNAIAELCEHF